MMHTRSSPRFELLGLRDRLIMDPVHGGIALSEIEVAIIDHPLFQRLRYICQNDILSLVFPGATHSRFLHSIGTMHVGHRIFKQLVENALAARVKEHGQAYELSEHQLAALHFFTQIVRLACLLHDCGHSSFSHQFSRAHSIQKLFTDGMAVKTLWQGIDTTRLFGEPPAKIVHEHFSVRCAMAIFDDALPASADFSMDDVLCLMETTSIQPSQTFRTATAELWPVLTGEAVGDADSLDRAANYLIGTLRLVVSGEFDADRADYMLRDGFHSSVTIGGFNIDHLLKNLHIGWDAEAEWMGFAVTGNGLGALEDFVYSRYQMYRKVYGHKTSQGFDLVLQHAINEVMADEEVCSFVYECLTNIQDFRHLTDNYFWEQFRRFARANPESWSERIINRRRLKHLRSVHDADAESLKATTATLEAELAEDGRSGHRGVLHCTLKARFSKIGKGYREIRVLNKRTGEYSDITHQSDFFSKFRDVSITHFYRKP
ncbi:phosphohydrolase [Allohahella marinimesophila]|uniref:HD/PDEase domain-containing protein n=1 Tax=Allohahella marinimesophila TaxID=1054972 RepID=A0ABP7Q9W0_9GAMM